jgi:hypothetical protein
LALRLAHDDPPAVSIGFCAAAVDAKVFTTILQWPGDSHDCAWVRSRPRDDGNGDSRSQTQWKGVVELPVAAGVEAVAVGVSG